MKKLNEFQVKLIKQIVDLNDEKKIVRLNVCARKDMDELSNEYVNNIYCIDNEYNIIWQVDAELTKFPGDPFVYIEMERDGIFAGKFSGFTYKVDVDSGKGKIIGFQK